MHPETPEEDNRIVLHQARFEQAVQEFQVAELQTEFEPRAVEASRAVIGKAGIFLLGETHGVRENPLIIYTIIKQFGLKALGLEWPEHLRDTVETYLATGHISFEDIAASPDGRITAGHFGLLKKLHEEGALQKLIFFREENLRSRSWSQVDADMAKSILENFRADAPTLVVAGNLHTRTSVFEADWPGDPGPKHSMGEVIRQTVPSVPAGVITCVTGAYHNYGVQEIEGREDQVVPERPRFYQDSSGLFIYQLPEAHPAVVPDPDERRSED